MAVAELDIIAVPLLAGMSIVASHVPLGREVLRRGIVFIDLAVAQVAALGVVVAGAIGIGEHALAAQLAAVSAAVCAALLLTWTERRWPHAQEPIIGVLFVVAASAGILLLAGDPHGGEQLRDLLAGQILWVGGRDLAVAVAINAAIVVAWMVARARLGRIGFYLLFSLAVTASVQVVGVYLVFATLIVPALSVGAIRPARQLPWAYFVGALGYALGIGASVAFDLPAGAMAVCALALAGAVVAGTIPRIAR